MGIGISIVPYRTDLQKYGPYLQITETIRCRICAVLSGVIDDQHLIDLRNGIWLPLLLIILRIYDFFTDRSDQEVRLLLNEIEQTCL
jgi:hypothetical protein